MTLITPGADSPQLDSTLGEASDASRLPPPDVEAAPGSVPATSGRSPLSVWTDQRADRCVLRLRGRLCADTVALLDRHVDRLGCRWCDEVVIDLSDLSAMDAVGARLVVGLGHYVGGRGGRFRVDSADPAVERRLAEAEIEMS